MKGWGARLLALIDLLLHLSSPSQATPFVTAPAVPAAKPPLCVTLLSNPLQIEICLLLQVALNVI